jgi:ATP-dependent Clp protease ATP-binding subunit ClpA
MSTAEAIAAKSQDVSRLLTEHDLVAALLHEKIGFLPRETRNSPFSFEALYIQLVKRRQDPLPKAPDVLQPADRAGETAASGGASEAVLSRYTSSLADALRPGRTSDYAPRTELIQRIAGILGRLNRPNPFIVGAPGVGKTALVENLMAWLRAGSGPAWLKGCSIHEVSQRPRGRSGL